MRLGIISDTHGTLPSSVHDVFSKVDRIVHAGDIGSEDIIVELETIAPLTAVFGNTDGFDVRDKVPREVKFELDGLYFTVTHGDQFEQPSASALRQAYPEADVLIYGHTHKAFLELIDKTVTVMNPGSASFPRGEDLPSVGIMETEVGLPPRARLVPLTD